MKDFDDFADEICELFYEETFSQILVDLERKGTRRPIQKEFSLKVDGRIVSQLENRIPDEEDWEYLHFLIEKTEKWILRDFHIQL